MIEELGFDGFLHRLLERAGYRAGMSLVVDGIRHEGALRALQRAVNPLHVNFVLLDISFEEREARIAIRRRPGDTSAASNFEADHERLRGMASMVISSGRTLGTM